MKLSSDIVRPSDSLSRRDFLKLGGAGLIGIFINPFLGRHEVINEQQGRVIEDNIIEDNGGMGMSFREGLIASEISNNTIANSDSSGLSIGSKFDGSLIKNNSITYSGAFGIYISKANQSVIQGNDVSESRRDGRTSRQ